MPGEMRLHPSAPTFDFGGLPIETIGAANGVIGAITQAHALTDTELERLRSAYSSIGDFLVEDDFFGNHAVEVHPQGSLLIGTTTRAHGRREIDVDLVLLLRRGVEVSLPCNVLLDRIHSTLKVYARRHDLVIERKRRCVQLQYSNQMHADITPVVQFPRIHGLHGQLFGLVPDADLSRYVGTNPKGYGRWFADAAAITPSFSSRIALDSVAKADIVPLPSVQIFDRLLCRIVQLLKIHRNFIFAAQPEVAPPSVVITTLAAQAYLHVYQYGFASPLDLVAAIWQAMPSFISRE